MAPATRAEAERLIALAEHLADLESWLPADAWEIGPAAAEPYLASNYLLKVTTYEGSRARNTRVRSWTSRRSSGRSLARLEGFGKVAEMSPRIQERCSLWPVDAGRGRRCEAALAGAPCVSWAIGRGRASLGRYGPRRREPDPAHARRPGRLRRRQLLAVTRRTDLPLSGSRGTARMWANGSDRPRNWHERLRPSRSTNERDAGRTRALVPVVTRLNEMLLGPARGLLRRWRSSAFGSARAPARSRRGGPRSRPRPLGPAPRVPAPGAGSGGRPAPRCRPRR